VTKRPNLLVVLGLALFLVGGAIVFLVVRDDNSSNSGASAKDLVPVLVATNDLTPGQSGDAVVAAGQVVVRQVPPSQRSVDAVTSTGALSGQTIVDEVHQGAQVLTSSLRQPNLRSASITIPTGKQAVAVTVDFTAGGAGYAAAGDHVNVYTVVAPNAPNVPTGDPPTTPFTKLLLSNVQILDVSDEVAPRVAAASDTASTTDVSGQARATGTTLTLLLALNAQQAEQIIFATSVNQLYFTVLPKGQGASNTKGVGYGTNYPVPSKNGAGK
jgi:Flp pilus assembly protein CpaB